MEAVSRVAELLVRQNLQLVVAESCTGGLLAARLTDPPGASQYFAGGLITYSNEAKQRLLEVPARLLEERGAVSEEVCLAMADGARDAAGADIAVSITGIAGPSGGSSAKPVGTVWIGVASEVGSSARRFHFDGDRGSIRRQSVERALEMLEVTVGEAAT